MTDKILIEVPDHIYYTGNVTVRYQRPDGEWYESTFFPGQYEEEIAKARATELAKVLSEVEEGLSMLTRYLRSIYRLDHSDGEPPQQMLLEDDVMSVLNQLKEGK